MSSAKPGPKTTEFWVTILTTAVGLGLIVFGVVRDNSTAIGWGTALAGVPTAAYVHARGLAKKPKP